MNYNINVTNQAIVSKPTQVNPSTSKPTQLNDSNKKQINHSAIVGAAAIQLSKQAITANLSRIGDKTGNRGQQTSINNAMMVLNTASTLATGALSGFAIGGAVGGAVGLGVAGTKIAFDMYQQKIDYDNSVFVEVKSRQFLASQVSFSNSNRFDGSE